MPKLFLLHFACFILMGFTAWGILIVFYCQRLCNTLMMFYVEAEVSGCLKTEMTPWLIAQLRKMVFEHMPDNFIFTFDNLVIHMNNLKPQQKCPSGSDAFTFLKAISIQGSQHSQQSSQLLIQINWMLIKNKTALVSSELSFNETVLLHEIPTEA